MSYTELSVILQPSYVSHKDPNSKAAGKNSECKTPRINKGKLRPFLVLNPGGFFSLIIM